MVKIAKNLFKNIETTKNLETILTFLFDEDPEKNICNSLFGRVCMPQCISISMFDCFFGRRRSNIT